MAKKHLKFSVCQLIINDSHFNIDVFADLKEEDLDKHEVTHREADKSEVLSIKKTIKKVIEDRFVIVYFLEGEKYPYSEVVINSDLEEAPNPRDPDELELDDQFFVLIDVQSQRIYLSDQKKKYLLIDWLEKKLSKKVSVKSIIDEKDFIDKIKTLNEISFTLAPDLLNSTSEGVLQKTLVEDIYGFGADKAKLKLIYNNTGIDAKIIEKLNEILRKRVEFESITVVGRSDENFETVFNIEGITNKVSIEVETSEDPKLLNADTVFDILVGKIKENDKRT